MKKKFWLFLLAFALLITSAVGGTLALQTQLAAQAADTAQPTSSGDAPSGKATLLATGESDDTPAGESTVKHVIENVISVRKDGKLTPLDEIRKLRSSVYTDHIRWQWKATESFDWDGEDEGIPVLLWDSEKIGNLYDYFVQVKNYSNEPVYVRTVLGFEADRTGFISMKDEPLVHLNTNTDHYNGTDHCIWAGPVQAEIDGVLYDLYTATYTQLLEPDKVTPPSLLQFAVDKHADNLEINQFGETYDILVCSQYIVPGDTDSWESAEVAFAEALGTVTAENHPWMENSDVTVEIVE